MAAQDSGLESDTERLFSGAMPDLSQISGRHAMIEKILEEGDTKDLSRLMAQVPEKELAAWLNRNGGRRLSARNRAFWSFVLGVDPPEAPALAELLWPL